MNYDDFKTLCETRRSIRSFEKPLEKEEIIKLLELARLAPSFDNLQPWHFHVIDQTDMRKKLTDACCYGDFSDTTGTFIVVTANAALENQTEKMVWNPKELEYSCMAAMENVLLGTAAMKAGGTWVSMHHSVAHEILGLPTDEVVVGGLLLGHPAAPTKSASKHVRKPLEEMYTFHQ